MGGGWDRDIRDYNSPIFLNRMVKLFLTIKAPFVKPNDISPLKTYSYNILASETKNNKIGNLMA